MKVKQGIELVLICLLCVWTYLFLQIRAIPNCDLILILLFVLPYMQHGRYFKLQYYANWIAALGMSICINIYLIDVNLDDPRRYRIGIAGLLVIILLWNIMLFVLCYIRMKRMTEIEELIKQVKETDINISIVHLYLSMGVTIYNVLSKRAGVSLIGESISALLFCFLVSKILDYHLNRAGKKVLEGIRSK